MPEINKSTTLETIREAKEDLSQVGGVPFVGAGLSVGRGLPVLAEFYNRLFDQVPSEWIQSNAERSLQAVYDSGVFRPTRPVNLPDGCVVDVVCPAYSVSNESESPFANERRVQLIRKQFEAGLSEAESQELQDLQEQSLQLLEKWDAALLANVDHMQAAVDEVVQAAKTSI